MTYTPDTMRNLKNWLEDKGVKVSIARDCDPSRHFYGYHLGKDQIFSTDLCVAPDGSNRAMGWNDYSVKTARDKAGLTNGRSGMDVEFQYAAKLRDFSTWLVKKCMAERGRGPRQYRSNNIREIIYSPDGKEVWRYDHESGTNTKGGGDNSHLWHTHISWYRDSEFLGKIRVFSGYNF